MSLREDALRAAVLKAIRDAIDVTYRQVRVGMVLALLDARRDTGLRSLDVELPDGTKVATVSLTQPKPSIRVDEAGFVAWVGKEHPSEIVPSVRDAFRRAVMDRLLAVGNDVVDKETGEAVTWAQQTAAPEPTTFSLRFAGPAGADGRGAIAAAWQAGQLDGYAPGPKLLTEAGPVDGEVAP